MVSKKLIFALCCSAGMALPLAVSAQLPTTPSAPTAPEMKLPSTGGGMTPSETKPPTSGGMPGTKAQDLTTPGTGGGSTPTSTDAPAPAPMDPPASTTPPKTTPDTKPSSTTPKKPGKSTTVKVNVNSSTLQELTKVKGIGAATAKKIVTNRPYATMDELVTKKALTKKQLTELKTQLEL
jgi:DNA uptake protein ComE-like DNA-binding protein